MSNFNREKARSRSAENADQHVDPVAGKSLAEVFGEIVWLLSQDPAGRKLAIKDLEWLVMPPMLLKQFHMTYARTPDGHTVEGEAVRKIDTSSRLQPIGIELYAMCSDVVAATVEEATAGSLVLTVHDWKSGPHKRVVWKTILS